MVVGNGCFVLILVCMAASAPTGGSSPAPAPPLHLSITVRGKDTLPCSVAHHPLVSDWGWQEVECLLAWHSLANMHSTVGVVHSITADLRQVNSCMDGAAQTMRTCRLAESFALHCCSAARALQPPMRLPGQAGLVLGHPW